MKVRFFINSYFVAGVVTLLTLIVAILAAYGFSRYSFRFKNTLNIFIIRTQTVPPITLLIPYFGMVVVFRIFDTYLALILTYMVISTLCRKNWTKPYWWTADRVGRPFGR